MPPPMGMLPPPGVPPPLAPVPGPGGMQPPPGMQAPGAAPVRPAGGVGWVGSYLAQSHWVVCPLPWFGGMQPQ